MKILIHTQYFPPEVGAPQNRLYELAVRLLAKGNQVYVLTAMPNYPAMEIHEGYKGKKVVSEDMNGLKILRSTIYVSKSKGIVKRLRNYFSFTWSSYWAAKRHLKGNFDVVICESPPLFLGISSFLLAKKFKSKFVFNVSDLWPESAEKLGVVTNPIFLKMATYLEEFLYKKADLISGQTQGIVRNISSRFPNKNTYWLPNGVDLNLYNANEIESNWREENGFKESDKLFLYAGIIGLAQGLEVILNAAERLKENTEIKFLLLGSGPVKEELIAKKNEMLLHNVHFLDLVPKAKMPQIVKAIDFAVIPLKKLDLFKGAIPSKIFENLAMKKPILLGVEGEAKELFIDKGQAGLFFEPENHEELAKCCLQIANEPDLINELGENAYQYVSEYFNRDLIAEDFYMELKKL